MKNPTLVFIGFVLQALVAFGRLAEVGRTWHLQRTYRKKHPKGFRKVPWTHLGFTSMEAYWIRNRLDGIRDTEESTHPEQKALAKLIELVETQHHELEEWRHRIRK